MEIDPERLRKYWKQECTEEERRQVERWLEAGEPDENYGVGNDLNEDKLQQELWSALTPKTVRQAVRPEMKSVSGRITPKRRRNMFLTSGIAASIILVGLLVFMLPKLHDKHTEPSIALYEEITAPYGKKMTVTLMEGSKIHLNSGSTLRYPKTFDDERRHVVLEGEAFFEVAKDPNRPFIVETARSNTHVLGTRFNLRDFADEPNSGIVVEEGRVQFTGNGCPDTLILVANDRAVFAENGMQQSNVQVSAYTDWRENILRFNDITLEEAVPIIERWYDVHVTLYNPELAALKIKGSFKQKSLKGVMDDFSYLLNLRYSINNRNISLYK